MDRRLDVVHAYMIDGAPHYLAYKAGTGDFAFARIHGDGAGRTDLVNSRTNPDVNPWPRGWTSFMPYRLADPGHR